MHTRRDNAFLAYIPSSCLAFWNDSALWNPTFLEGGLAFDWQFAQQRYFKSLRSMQSGRRWVSALIHKLWTVDWDQWEHRNSVLHERDSTKQHTLITQDTDRLISR
jgi:hypothetical protein